MKQYQRFNVYIELYMQGTRTHTKRLKEYKKDDRFINKLLKS